MHCDVLQELTSTSKEELEDSGIRRRTRLSCAYPHPPNVCLVLRHRSYVPSREKCPFLTVLIGTSSSVNHENLPSHQNPMATDSNNLWRKSILVGEKNSAVQYYALIDFLCKYGRLNKSDIVNVEVISAGVQLDLKSEESVLQVLGNINEVRKRGEQLPFDTRRCWPLEFFRMRLKASTELMQHKTGYYLDEIDLQVKPCQRLTETEMPARFRTNTILFKFTKSKVINADNAYITFAKVVKKCGGSPDDIKDVEPASEILTVTFRNEESASRVLKTFQEKKIRDELSAEFKPCRIFYDLPEHLQKKRNALFAEIHKEKANDYKYVDEFDLTIKTKPGMSKSHKTSSLSQAETQDPQRECNKRPSFTIYCAEQVYVKYDHMGFTQFMKELFGSYATDIELEERMDHGFKVSLKPTSRMTVDKLLAHLGKQSVQIYYATNCPNYRHMGFEEFMEELFGVYAKDIKMEVRYVNGFDVSLKPTARTSIEKLLMCLPEDVNLAIFVSS
uniref:Ubiquitinyl hydrolase 1 n=1 Tax=Steinernema glaseri TaxID=37863 RepID=A0A1I8ASY6_9BILA